jgi:ethanolamine utilization protein EutP (predicted NTPase)
MFASGDLSSIERHECDHVLIEFAIQLGKILKRSAQSVYFIDHHTIDTSCFNVGHQTLERRAFHGAARKSNIVVVIWKADPTFVLLALDINLRRFPLGIERVGLPF